VVNRERLCGTNALVCGRVRCCVCAGMALIFWMMQNLGVRKGFFLIKAAASHDRVHTRDEVDAFIDRCVWKSRKAHLSPSLPPSFFKLSARMNTRARTSKGERVSERET